MALYNHWTGLASCTAPVSGTTINTQSSYTVYRGVGAGTAGPAAAGPRTATPCRASHTIRALINVNDVQNISGAATPCQLALYSTVQDFNRTSDICPANYPVTIFMTSHDKIVGVRLATPLGWTKYKALPTPLVYRDSQTV